MEATLLLLLASALAMVALGGVMMHHGHRHQVRRDRRADDRRPT